MRLILITLMLSLPGCSTNVSGSWDCPAPKGGKCLDLTTVDKQAIKKLKGSTQIHIAPFVDEGGYVQDEAIVSLDEVSHVK
jgi:hypothetical protein